MSQASSQNHGTSATATKADEEILAGNQLMALAASAAPAPMAAKESAGNTVQAPVEKATEAPAPMAAKESAGRLLAVNQLLALAASAEPAPPNPHANKKAIQYGLDNLLKRVDNHQKYVSYDLNSIKGAETIFEKAMAASRTRRFMAMVFILQGMDNPKQQNLARNIVKLLKGVFNKGCWPIISELVKQEGLIACGIRNGETVFASIVMKTSTPMVIIWFGVHGRFRSCGIGSFLMHLACRIQRQMIGRVDIFLVADFETEKAIQFYEREGFVSTDWGKNEEIDQLGKENGYFGDHIYVPMRLKLPLKLPGQM